VLAPSLPVVVEPSRIRMSAWATWFASGSVNAWFERSAFTSEFTVLSGPMTDWLPASRATNTVTMFATARVLVLRFCSSWAEK
jgi:hypothetical protein